MRFWVPNGNKLGIVLEHIVIERGKFYNVHLARMTNKKWQASVIHSYAITEEELLAQLKKENRLESLEDMLRRAYNILLTKKKEEKRTPSAVRLSHDEAIQLAVSKFKLRKIGLKIVKS